MSNQISKYRIRRFYANGSVCETEDTVSVEAKLIIEINGAVSPPIFCSPHSLSELAAGYIFIEYGITVTQIMVSRKGSMGNYRAVCCADGWAVKYSKPEPVDVLPEVMMRIGKKLLCESELFKITGNMHVSALCRGEDICYIGEDISRHNTLYRAIGACIRDGKNPGNYYFCTSGRAPYSMVLVVIKAGIRVLISRSAPTDLSLELAKKHGLTLAGFVSENRVNLYTGHEMRRKTVGLVILAGGKSSRMNGFDKSMLILGGRTFFERLSKELSFMGEKLLSANTVSNGVPKGFQLVFDEEKEIGAMGGICAALKKCESDALLVVPCDTPLFTKECAELVIGELADYDACLFRVGGTLQPLNGIYSKTCIPVFETCIRNKQYKLADSLEQLRVKIINGKADYNFLNINTPDDYEAAKEKYGLWEEAGCRP